MIAGYETRDGRRQCGHGETLVSMCRNTSYTTFRRPAGFYDRRGSEALRRARASDTPGEPARKGWAWGSGASHVTQGSGRREAEVLGRTRSTTRKDG